MGLDITTIEFEDTLPSLDDVISLAEETSGLQIEKGKSRCIVFSEYPNEKVNYTINGNCIELFILMGQFSLLRNLLAVSLVAKGGVNKYDKKLSVENYEYWRAIRLSELRPLHFKNRIKIILTSLPGVAIYSIPVLIIGYISYIITTLIIR